MATEVEWTLSGREINVGDAIIADDRLVIVDWESCLSHDDCRVLTVAPDDTDTLEYPHVRDSEHYRVRRILR